MIPQETPPLQTDHQHTAWKKSVFRVVAVLMGLLVFPLLEASCYLLDIGQEDIHSDPFVGFAEIRPLFEPSSAEVRNQANGGATMMETSRTRRGFFAAQSFKIPKPKREFRIFVFGGSTVQGNPFQPETSFTTFLQQALATASSEYDWKVINCGGISYASYRLVPIVEECTAYEPDLFIFCEGHNEFLEDITYSELKSNATQLSGVYETLSQFRSFRLLDRTLRNEHQTPIQPLSDARPVLSAEVDALLDHQGGLEKYHRDEHHACKVVQHFQTNLKRVVRIAQTQRIPLLMMMPPSNLRDCPPFKAECSANVSAEALDQIKEDLDEAAKHLAADPDRSIDHLLRAAEADPHFAFTWYHLGHAYLAAHRIDDAKAAFLRARDEDICPLRMTSSLEDAMQSVAKDHSCAFIDLYDLLAEHSRDGILGDDLLVDHIHPSFEGHQHIAIRIAEWMTQAKLVTPSTGNWAARSRDVFRRHVESLDSVYFLRGQRALRDLRGWAAGRARKPFMNRGDAASPTRSLE